MNPICEFPSYEKSLRKERAVQRRFICMQSTQWCYVFQCVSSSARATDCTLPLAFCHNSFTSLGQCERRETSTGKMRAPATQRATTYSAQWWGRFGGSACAPRAKALDQIRSRRFRDVHARTPPHTDDDCVACAGAARAHPKSFWSATLSIGGARVWQEEGAITSAFRKIGELCPQCTRRC